MTGRFSYGIPASAWELKKETSTASSVSAREIFSSGGEKIFSKLGERMSRIREVLTNMAGVSTRTRRPAALVMALGIRLVLMSFFMQISQGVNISAAIIREPTTDSEETVHKLNGTFTKASAEIQENIHLSNCESQKVLEILVSPGKKLCADPIKNSIPNDYTPLTEEKQEATALDKSSLPCPEQTTTNNEMVKYLKEGVLLHFLAETNATDAVRSLLLLGADTSKQDRHGDTPLHYTVRGRAYEIMRLLLKAGADPKIKGADKLTALEAAAERGDTEAVSILIHEGTNDGAIEETADVFRHVIGSSNYNALKKLIDGTGILPKQILNIALEEAIRKEDREAIGLLIAAKSDNGHPTKDVEGYPLSEATARGREDILKDLLDAWGYVDERNYQEGGRTPLMAAAYNNNPRSARMLVEAGAPLEDKDDSNQTALFYAAHVTGYDALLALIELGADVNATDRSGENTLHKTVRHNPEAVAVLLEAGIDKEARNTEGRTPVFMLARQSSDALRLLLDANVSLNVRDNDNFTPFLFHAFNGDEYGTALLLEWTPDLEEQDDEGNTALLLAARQAAYARRNYPIYNYTALLNTVRTLVEAGADVDTQNFEGLSPLLLFVETGFPDGEEYMLEAGADSDIRDVRGYTPLHSMVERGFVSYSLLRHGADVNARDRLGRTPLMVAAARGRALVLPLLLDAGAAVNVRDYSRRTALHWAAKRNVETLKPLLQNGADVNATDQWGRTPLHWADGSEWTVKELLNAGSDKNAQDNSGATPLLIAVYNRCEACVRKLVQAEVDMNIPDKRGVTPLMQAVEENDMKIVKLLLKAGADQDLRDKEGSTALHRATLNGSVNALRSLIEMGVTVDAKDNNGKTPLHLASERNNLKALEALLAAGAQPSLADKLGRTALHRAVGKGCGRVVKRLIEAGAHVDAVDDEWKTPLWYAMLSDDATSAALLVGAGADVNHEVQGRTPLDLAMHMPNLEDWKKILLETKTSHSESAKGSVR